MKTNSILIKEGKAFAVCEEIPKEPEKGTCSTEPVNDCYKDYEHCLCAKEWKPYREALQRVKDNAVLFENQDLVTSILVDNLCDCYDNTFYPLSVEVDIIEVPEYPTSYAPVKRVARIVEEPEEKPCSPLCFDFNGCKEHGCTDVKGRLGIKDWTEVVNGHIDVPDDLMPIFNKVATQMRFHTISGKSEVEACASIVFQCQKFFTSKSVPDSEVEDQEALQKLADKAYNDAKGESIHYWGMPDDDPEVKYWKEIWIKGYRSGKSS